MDAKKARGGRKPRDAESARELIDLFQRTLREGGKASIQSTDKAEEVQDLGKVEVKPASF